jgi:hypothetical protein
MEESEYLEKYNCADYLNSSLFDAGFWDEEGQLWLIEPGSKAQERPEIGFLQIGRPGFDGIGFGYRSRNPGFWAYHPIDSRFQLLAPSLDEFLKGWYAGNISV